MNVKHLGGVEGEEHRIVVSMTTLEARLWLRAQPYVREVSAAMIRKALSCCDEQK